MNVLSVPWRDRVAPWGVNRKAFWIPLHVALTLLLPVAAWACRPKWLAHTRNGPR